VWYRNRGTDAAPNFSTYDNVLADDAVIDFPGSPRTRPIVTDWNGDRRLDLVVGVGDGTVGQVYLFMGVPEPPSRTLLVTAGMVVLPILWVGKRRRGTNSAACTGPTRSPTRSLR
jgi:hypothetical protein